MPYKRPRLALLGHGPPRLLSDPGTDKHAYVIGKRSASCVEPHKSHGQESAREEATSGAIAMYDNVSRLLYGI